MKRFEFAITIAGNSENGNPDEAWIDACQSFALDYGTCPDNFESEDDEKPKREYLLISTLDANIQKSLDSTDMESALYEALNFLNYTVTSNKQ